MYAARANELSNWNHHRRDCKIYLALCVTHRQPLARRSPASTASRGQAMCFRIPTDKRVREGSVRCQDGNRCWKRRAAIFRFSVAKDCDITTFTRRLSTKRTESFFYSRFSLCSQSGILKEIFFPRRLTIWERFK